MAASETGNSDLVPHGLPLSADGAGDPVSVDATLWRRIVEAGTLAPSPDNNQPWRFHISGSRLIVDHDPERALPSDSCAMFSLIALGAVLENLDLAAGREGFRLRRMTAEEEEEEREATVAVLRLEPGGPPDPLHRHLSTRATNRGPYSKEPVDLQTLALLAEEVPARAGVDLTWLTHRTGIRSLSWLVASADRIRFEHRSFHDELHRQLRLTVREAEATRDGLDVRTLGAPPGSALLLRALRPWPRMRALNRLGLSRALSVPTAMTVRASAAIGFLTVSARTAPCFLAGGRAFQRLWLRADSLGLDLHPLGSLPIYLAHGSRPRGGGLPPETRGCVRGLGTRLARLVPGLGDRPLLMMFRLGHGQPQAVRSLRRPVDEVLVERRGEAS